MSCRTMKVCTLLKSCPPFHEFNIVIIPDDTGPLELATASRGEESIVTRRLRFADMPSILASRATSADSVGGAIPSRLSLDDPSHIFERTQSPSLSESSSVVAARSRLGLVRNPDLITRGQRMRDQLLRWRSISRSPASFGDNPEAVSNLPPSPPRNGTTGPANDPHARVGTLLDLPSPSAMSPINHTSSFVPESSSHHASIPPRQSDSFQEMREIFEPFEPFSFDENQDSSAPTLPPVVAGNGQRATRHRASRARDEVENGLSAVYHGGLSDGNETLEPRHNFGTSSISRSSHFPDGNRNIIGSPQVQHRTARFVDTPEGSLWHEARMLSANTPDDRRDRQASDTQREIRRLTTLVDELQESIRSRPSTIQPAELRSNGTERTFLRHRPLRTPRELPRRALIDEDYPLSLPPLPPVTSSNGRSTSRSLLDPNLSVGLSSSSSSSSRQSWTTTSEWAFSRPSATQARRTPRVISPLWSTDEDDNTDTDLFDHPSWSSGVDGPRPLSSLFSGTGRFEAAAMIH